MNKLLRFSIAILLILGLVLIGGCASSPAPSPPNQGGGDEGEAVDDVTNDRKIVREGSITLEVEGIAEAMDQIAEMADELNGYVVSSRRYDYERRVLGYITIRIPSDSFEDALARLRQLAIAVPYETTTARDVTEEYVDLEAQLGNLLATEAQYLTLMERAETVEEVLMVQKELSKVRGQIEQIEGRMRYLEQTSDMSLIEVDLQETRGLAEPWSPSAVLEIGSAWADNIRQRPGHCAHLAWRFLLGLDTTSRYLAQKTPKSKS
jgi:hypothetical protein